MNMTYELLINFKTYNITFLISKRQPLLEIEAEQDQYITLSCFLHLCWVGRWIWKKGSERICIVSFCFLLWAFVVHRKSEVIFQCVFGASIWLLYIGKIHQPTSTILHKYKGCCSKIVRTILPCTKVFNKQWKLIQPTWASILKQR